MQTSTHAQKQTHTVSLIRNRNIHITVIEAAYSLVLNVPRLKILVATAWNVPHEWVILICNDNELKEQIFPFELWQNDQKELRIQVIIYDPDKNVYLDNEESNLE